MAWKAVSKPFFEFLGGSSPHEMLIFLILFMGEAASGAGTTKFASNLLKLGSFMISNSFFMKLWDRIFFQKKSVFWIALVVKAGGRGTP